MKNEIYPAIFHKTEKEGFWVEFPDLPGCLTEANTLDEAYNMAGDALYAWLNISDREYPAPSSISDIKAESGDFVTLVKAEAYESAEAVKVRAAVEIETGLAKRKLNKNQAAQILGVNRSLFTHIVNGKKTPSPEMAKRIGLLLDLDWRIFFSDGTSAL